MPSQPFRYIFLQSTTDQKSNPEPLRLLPSEEFNPIFHDYYPNEPIGTDSARRLFIGVLLAYNPEDIRRVRQAFILPFPRDCTHSLLSLAEF